jgi:hypothetical protein
MSKSVQTERARSGKITQAPERSTRTMYSGAYW